MRPSNRIRLIEEQQPSHDVVAIIDAIDDLAMQKDMDLDTLAEYLRSQLPGAVHGFARSLLPDRPTQALPGTPEKIAVMAERAHKRQHLFHPADAQSCPKEVLV